VPINAPQAPQKPVLAATKRVQVALNGSNGSHPAAAPAKTSGVNASSTPASDGDSANVNASTPHRDGVQVEFGA
jgi:hypothetical protein